MKIVFFGTPHFVIPVLEALEKNFEVVTVVTSRDEKSGRKQVLTPSPIKNYFKNKVLTPETLDSGFEKDLDTLSPDLLVVAAYGKIIPLQILGIAKYGALNIHPSLLPKYRGASPIQQAILNGDKKTGVSIIKMDEKMDHGPVVFSKNFEILEHDTFETLSLRLFYETSKFLPDTVKDFIAGKIIPEIQDDKLASFCPIIKKTDGYFELGSSLSLEKLERMEKAYYPWPTAWTRWNGKILKFYPGKVVQMEGKKSVSYQDFINGYPNLDKNLLNLLK
jgi:methionyl-tRNA formyltransferase